MTKFKVGKTYSIKNEIGKSWFKSYEIVARTACTLTLKDESGKIIRCRISKKFSAFNKAETAFPEGIRSGNYPIRADMPSSSLRGSGLKSYLDTMAKTQGVSLLQKNELTETNIIF